jgi:hypothetical protein
MINRTQTPQPPVHIGNHQQSEGDNSMLARYSLFKVGYIENYLPLAGTEIKRVLVTANF